MKTHEFWAHQGVVLPGKQHGMYVPLDPNLDKAVVDAALKAKMAGKLRFRAMLLDKNIITRRFEEKY